MKIMLQWSTLDPVIQFVYFLLLSYTTSQAKNRVYGGQVQSRNGRAHMDAKSANGRYTIG